MTILTAKDYEQANAKVNAILENARAADRKAYTLLPEPYIPYAKVCCEIAGLRYSKKTANDWMSTFQDWISAGYQPDDVADAVRAIHKDGKILICRPGSITHRLDGEAALKRSKHTEEKNKYTGGAFAEFIEH